MRTNWRETGESGRSNPYYLEPVPIDIHPVADNLWIASEARNPGVMLQHNLWSRVYGPSRLGREPTSVSEPCADDIEVVLADCGCLAAPGCFSSSLRDADCGVRSGDHARER